jgi:glutamine cyclotransferase
VPVYLYRVVNVYPHDSDAYTQGLVYEDGTLYEGTGLWGESSLRRVDLGSGEVLQIYRLPGQYFGEGIAIVGDRIVQLTYQSQIGFVYDRATFELVDTFGYPTQGWGLTYDGTHLIMSDGSDVLYFLDPTTFLEVGRVAVQDRGRPIFRLNELEYIHEEIYANVYQTDLIARIDPLTGDVTAWINLTGLLAKEEVAQAEVLNGIAYDAQGDRLFVTGKFWPKLFEIELVPLDESHYLPHIVRLSLSALVSSN